MSFFFSGMSESHHVVVVEVVPQHGHGFVEPGANNGAPSSVVQTTDGVALCGRHTTAFCLQFDGQPDVFTARFEKQHVRDAGQISGGLHSFRLVHGQTHTAHGGAKHDFRRMFFQASHDFTLNVVFWTCLFACTQNANVFSAVNNAS